MKPAISLLAVLALPLSLTAATISGTVTNQTTNKPASGDVAVLIDLRQTMQESARTTIDARGHFSFTVPDLTAMHVVQVEHQKASYYAPVPPNTPTVNLDIYDVAEKVAGVHVYSDVSRVQTDSQGLNVTESFTVRNESKPPRTQFSSRAFEFVLPPGATLQEGTTTGPGGMTVKNAPVPLQDKDHYAFLFPLRPGETHLQVTYQLPYSGSFEFHAAVSTPTDNFAVTLPTSMKFRGSGFQPFHGSSDQPDTATYLAADVQPGAASLVYNVSGKGKLPPEPRSNGPQTAGMGPMGAQGNAPGGGMAPPIDSPDPLDKYKWWIISLVALAFVITAAFFMRSRAGLQTAAAGGPPSPESMPSPLVSAVPPGVKATALRARIAAPERHVTAPPPRENAPQTTPLPRSAAPSQSSPMLIDLKEELFAVETERLQGKLPEEEARQLKAGLEVLMRRALTRRSNGD